MNLEAAIEKAMREEFQEAFREELEQAKARLGIRLAEIAARVPIKVMRQNDLAQMRASFTVEIDDKELKQKNVS